VACTALLLRRRKTTLSFVTNSNLARSSSTATATATASGSGRRRGCQLQKHNGANDQVEPIFLQETLRLLLRFAVSALARLLLLLLLLLLWLRLFAVCSGRSKREGAVNVFGTFAGPAQRNFALGM